MFDTFKINGALDIIEDAGGSFHLVKCQVGQSADAMSYSELEVRNPQICLFSIRAIIYLIHNYNFQNNV